ncbi:MAG TPA: hypothetical protein VIG29_07335 [Vicinamibacteria bacterium]|jgi:hypothetical protein
MPGGLLDAVEAFFELLDFLEHWRFWVPVLISVAIAVSITRTIPDPALRWMVGVPLVLAGIVAGIRWQRGRK